MNYRDLLRRYIQMIKDWEGIIYQNNLEDYAKEGKFTSEEVAEIIKLSEEKI